MIYWRRLIPWLLRAWPVLVLAPVAAAHATALQTFPTDTVFVNKLVGMSLQVLGGLVVLYSVNDNLGLFRSQSLTSTVIAWFREFPLVRKPISLAGSASSMVGATASMSATVTRAVNTLEERVAEVERRLLEVQRQLEQEVQAINVRIEEAKSQLRKQIDETSTRISDLS